MKKWMKVTAILSAMIVILFGILPVTWILAGKMIALLPMKEKAQKSYGIGSIPMSEDGFYEIRSAEDYRIFWDEAGYKNSSVKGRLMCDIRLNDTSGWQEWEKGFYGYSSSSVLNFSGVFDGNGHTIYGIYSENGYGIVRTNEGIIRNLTIRDSVICGGIYGGGICYHNEGRQALISNCKFYGKITNVVNVCQIPEEMAGICVINSGTIAGCGFMGEFRLDEKHSGEKCESAGICVQNYGNVENCFNLSFCPLNGENVSYAIANQGEKNCYTLRDSGFCTSDKGQVTELSMDQRLQLQKYLDRDILALWKSGKPAYQEKSLAKAEENELRRQALQDETVKNMIFSMLSREKGDIRDFDFRASKEEGAEFCLTIAYKGKELLVSKYQGTETDDMEKLWCREGEILAEKDADSFGHTTYFLLQNEVPSESTEIFTSYQTNTDQGFFYVSGDCLYRIAQGASGTEDEKEALLSMAEEEICSGKIKSTGIVWKDDTVKKAVYESLKEEQDALLSREEIRNLKELEIENGKDIKTLADLANLTKLTSLIIWGDGQVNAIGEMKNYALPELTELILYDCGITDISFVENYKKLTRLSLGCNNISDISSLKDLTQLESLALFSNQIDDIGALGDMEKLVTLNLTDNRISDLSPLRGKTKMTILGLSFNCITDISPLEGMTDMVNLSIGSNHVKNIGALSNMRKLQWLGLEGNEIEDYNALAEIKNLFYLDVMGNPSQDIGDLYSIPYLLLGNKGTGRISEEELRKAQNLLNRSPSEQGIEAQDIAYGDLNRDGIRDVAITGYFGEKKDEDGYTEEWGTRRVYIFMGTGEEDYELLAVVDTLNPDMGGVYGDPYQGISLSGNHLIVQNYGGSFFRWADTVIYEYKNGMIQLAFCYTMNEWIGNNSGYDWFVYDYVQDTEKKYAVMGEWDQPVEMLLIADDSNRSDERNIRISEQFESAWKELEQKGAESNGQTFPEPDYWNYAADIDGGGYYDYEIHKLPMKVKSDPTEVLTAAVEEFFLPGTAICFPIKEYSSEEIKSNYDRLAGVELPDVFYVGREPSGEWKLLTYVSCHQDEDGSYVHKLLFSEPNTEYEEWFCDKTFYYCEKDGTFVLP